MESLKMMFFLFVCIVGCLELAAGIATSHQSFSSGDGWRYSYGIVHGPHGIGHAEGESYPHGYGGFGTYAPSYGYDGYGLSHHHEVPHVLHHEIPHELHHEIPHELHHEIPHELHHEIPHEIHYEVPQVLPVPAVHAPLPPVHSLEHYPSYHGTPLPYSYPFKTEEVKFVEPIKTIYPLPHTLPHAEGKPFSAPAYILPSYQAGQHYGSGYLGDYSNLFSNYFSGHDDHSLGDFKGFQGLVLPEHGIRGDYLGDHYKALYKPNYNDYYGSTSYHH